MDKTPGGLIKDGTPGNHKSITWAELQGNFLYLKYFSEEWFSNVGTNIDLLATLFKTFLEFYHGLFFSI